jgi:hypothetical protein
MTSQEPAEIGRPRAEVRESRLANEILKAAPAFFAAGLDRPRPTSWGLIHQHKDVFGVEPVCQVLPRHGCGIAPGRYYAARSRPGSARAVRDEGAADAVRRRGGEKVATRPRLPRFAARHEATETPMSGPGAPAGCDFPAGWDPK